MVAAVNLTCVLVYLTTEIYSKGLADLKAEIRNNMVIKNSEIESEMKKMTSNILFLEEFGNWWNKKLDEQKEAERKINLLNSRSSLNLIMLGFAVVLLFLEIFFNTSFTLNEFILYPRHIGLIIISFSTILHGITLRHCSITAFPKVEEKEDEERDIVLEQPIEAIQDIGVIQSLITLFSKIVLNKID